MILEVIENLPRLQELQSQWLALVKEVSHTTPFHLPPWQLTWWKHFGSGQLRTFAFFDGDALIGLIPCFRHEWEGAQQLTLVGSGITDFLEPPIRPGYEVCVGEHLKRRLSSQTDWDLCNWQDLLSGTPLQRLIDSPTLQAQLTEETPCSAISLNGSFTDYWQTRSNELKRNVRRYMQKAEAEGPMQFEAIASAQPELINALIRLHSARWQKRGETGTIAANRSANFLRDIAVEFASAGILRLLSLSWNRQTVAIILAFSWKKTLYGYLSAFDPQFEKLGFGRILLFNAIQYAFGTGHASWNFLRGDEPYKAWWGAQPVAKSRLLIQRRGS